MSTQTASSCPSRPPHCPNPNCSHHNPQPGSWPVVRFGYFRRKTPPFVIQRFRCITCRRTFSTQTFATTYWLKRPDLLLQVLEHATAGAANRQIARLLKAAPSTIDHHLARLGRHCLLFHRQLMAKLSPRVDVALDGLVTFEYSQYFPYEIVAAVDRPSSFVIHFAEAERRRSGTMTAQQRKRRAQLEETLGRADPKALMRALVEVLSESVQGARRAHVWSDQHRTYPVAIAKIQDCAIEHETIDSRAPRTARNPLFEVNVLDMLLRHCLKDHTRETIAFGRRRQHSIYRLAVFTVWRNCMKLRREKRCRSTPAMLVGLVERLLGAADVLARRLFVTQFRLPALWDDYYWRRVQTRALVVNRGHALTYAT
jgi:transposase-like protein